MVLCGICLESESKYKCPKCTIAYCSLLCYKSEIHKAKDEKIDNSKEAFTTESGDTTKTIDSSVIDNSEIKLPPIIQLLINNQKFKQYMQSPTLQIHLKTILSILQEVSLTNEYTSEGRKEVAVKFMGDLSNNEEVDDFFEWLFKFITENEA